VFTIALYASLVYGLLFLNLEVFPIVFKEQRHFSLIISTLPFLGLLVGVIFALIVNIVNQPLYARAVERNNGKAVPEARLPPMIIGGCLFSTGLFWFGWTADPKISWVSPTVAAGTSSESLSCADIMPFSKLTNVHDKRIHWSRIQYCFSAMSQFSGGYLWSICCKCRCGKQSSSLLNGLWAAVGGETHVSGTGGWTGIEYTWWNIFVGIASPSFVYEI